jgi:ribosomal protein S18 acetylase RimI-like enzyme
VTAIRLPGNKEMIEKQNAACKAFDCIIAKNQLLEPLLLKIRTLEPADWPTHRLLRLRALENSPDAFGATHADQAARPHESWAARLEAAAMSDDDCPLVAEQDGVPVGLAWAKVDGADPTVVEIFQVWVAPAARGRGIAAALLREAISWARSRGTRTVKLDVTQGDTAAVRLYQREGFRNVGEPVPFRPGSPLLSQAMCLDL